LAVDDTIGITSGDGAEDTGTSLSVNCATVFIVLGRVQIVDNA